MSPTPPPATAPAPQAASGTAASSLNFFGQIPTNAPTVSTPGTAEPVLFQNASLSPYFLQQIGNSPVDLGGGLSGQGKMSIDQAVTWFDNLPAGQLMQIESMLWSAGFYTDASGNPLKTAPVLGTLDDQGRRAFLNSLIAAYSSGQSVTDTLNQAIQSGAGAELRSTLPGAVLGGGNTYTIDLTQPGAVNQTASQIFEAALGRLPSQDELSKITDAINSGAITQGLAKEAGAEASSMQRYQAQVNQRNIQYQFETTPKTALGAVPSGAINNPAEYASTLLQYMGMPQTASNIAFLTGWMQAMGGNMAGNNPLGSQNAVPGSQPSGTATPSYGSWQQSLQATAAALTSGPYTNIMSALLGGSASSAAGNPALQAEIKKWSGGVASDITAEIHDQGNMQQASQQVQIGQQQGQGPQYAGGPGSAGNNATAQSMGAEGGGPAQDNFLNAGGTAQALGAEGGGPNAPGPTTPAADVTPGQQQTNPGDQYVNPVTVYSQNPLSPAEASYLAATTGPNRFGFAENNYLNAFLAVANLIQSGRPTG